MLIHLVTIPVHEHVGRTPPGRPGPPMIELLAGESWPISQLWLFWVAPIVGGLLGA